MIIVYTAGPYRGDRPIDVKRNIRTLCKVCRPDPTPQKEAP